MPGETYANGDSVYLSPAYSVCADCRKIEKDMRLVINRYLCKKCIADILDVNSPRVFDAKIGKDINA